MRHTHTSLLHLSVPLTDQLPLWAVPCDRSACTSTTSWSVWWCAPITLPRTSSSSTHSATSIELHDTPTNHTVTDKQVAQLLSLPDKRVQSVLTSLKAEAADQDVREGGGEQDQ